MNIVSLLVVLALAALAAYMAVRMSVAISGDFHAGRQFRRALIERVRRLRLQRMLDRRGISAEEYLHRQPAVDIEQRIRACESCDATQQCDVALASRKEDTDLSFCANDEAFNRYRNVVPIVAAPSDNADTAHVHQKT
ncbi:MAG: DUF6455 family protein [Gammaproteobacteria bacterium]